MAREMGLVVEQTDNLVVITDAKGRIEWVNPAFTRLTGFSSGQAVGKTPTELLGSGMDPRAVEAFDAYLRRPASRRFDIHTTRVSGAPLSLDLNIKAVLDKSLRPVRLIAIGNDITARVQADEELLKLSWAVENSPASVVITDRDGNIEYVNPKFTAITGYPREEVMGRNPRILNAGALPKSFYADLWSTILRGEEWHGQMVNRKKNGETYWEQASISPIKDPSGKITHFVGVKEDITERITAAQDLARAKEAAEAASRAKSIFLAQMSHEIRTPMNAILGFSQLMLRDPDLTPGQRSTLDIINKSGEHLLALIDDVLEMSKIEAGRATVTVTPFDLEDMVWTLEAMFRVRAEAKGLRFTVSRAEPMPRIVVGDQSKIRQILINLLGNAIKFTTTGAVELKVAAIPDHARGLLLSAEVIDSGPGIPSEEQEAIFQYFEQASAGRREGSGTGLGLAISRHYARVMGGELTVRSEPGKGSKFSFVISLEEGVREIPSPAATQTIADRLRLRRTAVSALAVDDNPEGRALMAGFLQHAGFAVQTAASAQEAIALFDAERPSLILMDVRMPATDGLAATRAIRSRPGGDAVKIICVSASVFEDSLVRAMEAGADGFLAKPLRESDLMASIGALLGPDVALPDEVPSADQAPGDAVTLLPAALRDALHHAILSADIERIHALAEETAPLDALLAQKIRDLAGEFDYPRLMQLIGITAGK